MSIRGWGEVTVLSCSALFPQDPHSPHGAARARWLPRRYTLPTLLRRLPVANCDEYPADVSMMPTSRTRLDFVDLHGVARPWPRHTKLRRGDNRPLSPPRASNSAAPLRVISDSSSTQLRCGAPQPLARMITCQQSSGVRDVAWISSVSHGVPSPDGRPLATARRSPTRTSGVILGPGVIGRISLCS